MSYKIEIDCQDNGIYSARRVNDNIEKWQKFYSERTREVGSDGKSI